MGPHGLDEAAEERALRGAELDHERRIGRTPSLHLGRGHLDHGDALAPAEPVEAEADDVGAARRAGHHQVVGHGAHHLPRHHPRPERKGVGHAFAIIRTRRVRRPRRLHGPCRPRGEPLPLRPARAQIGVHVFEDAPREAFEQPLPLGGEVRELRPVTRRDALAGPVPLPQPVELRDLPSRTPDEASRDLQDELQYALDVGTAVRPRVGAAQGRRGGLHHVGIGQLVEGLDQEVRLGVKGLGEGDHLVPPAGESPVSPCPTVDAKAGLGEQHVAAGGLRGLVNRGSRSRCIILDAVLLSQQGLLAGRLRRHRIEAREESRVVFARGGPASLRPGGDLAVERLEERREDGFVHAVLVPPVL